MNVWVTTFTVLLGAILIAVATFIVRRRHTLAPIIRGHGRPTNEVGRHGQFYLDVDDYRLYGPKKRAKWPMHGKKLVGPTGKQLLYGVGPPTTETGVDGDFYLDTLISALYGPKNGGVWPIPTSLVGPSGTSMLTGSTSPGATTGKAGDSFFDQTSYLFYGPKAVTGIWPTPVSLKGDPGPEGKQGPAGTSATYWGRVAVVDQINGDDSTGTVNGPPFLTLNAAMTACSAGDMMYILPGTYAESLVIKDGVSIRGIAAPLVRIALTNPTSGTAAVTMGENSLLMELTISVTSTSNGAFTGLLFPGTTAATANVLATVVNVDNSAAPLAGTSSVYGVRFIGTGVATSYQNAMRGCTVRVASTGTASTAVALELDTAAQTVNVREVTLTCTAALGATGSFFGAQCNVLAGVLNIRTSTISGTTSDISQTAGTLMVDATDLINGTANDLGFAVGNVPSFIPFGDTGALSTGQVFFRLGTASASGTESVTRIPSKCTLRSISVEWRSAPALNRVDTLVVRKNGVDTSMSVTTTSPGGSAAFGGQNENASITFMPGDTISVRSTAATGAGGTDTQIVLGFY